MAHLISAFPHQVAKSQGALTLTSSTPMTDLEACLWTGDDGFISVSGRDEP